MDKETILVTMVTTPADPAEVPRKKTSFPSTLEQRVTTERQRIHAELPPDACDMFPNHTRSPPWTEEATFSEQVTG